MARADPTKLHQLAGTHAQLGELHNTLADLTDQRYNLVEELIAEGMTQGEIGRHLGITTQAVGDLRRRGRNRRR